MKKLLSIFTVVGLATFFFTSCGNDLTSNSGQGQSSVGFYLTDAPIVKKGYLAVNLYVKGVSYSVDAANWTPLPISQSIVEITKFSNGKNLFLSNIVLDAGVKVIQVRLLLGPNNTVVLSDGTVKPLIVPSGYTSGLKLNVQSVPTLTSGYKVLIDFDAARSIVARGNGTFSLKPVVRSYIEANTSYIDGYLSPKNLPVRIFTINPAGDTISTVSDTLNYNYFRLTGLFSGTYKLQVENLATDSIYTLVDEVPVLGGTDVHISTVALPTLIP